MVFRKRALTNSGNGGFSALSSWFMSWGRALYCFELLSRSCSGLRTCSARRGLLKTCLASGLTAGLGLFAFAGDSDSLTNQLGAGLWHPSAADRLDKEPHERCNYRRRFHFWNQFRVWCALKAPWFSVSSAIANETSCEAAENSKVKSLSHKASASIGSSYDYVIIGGGPAAHEAAAELARCDADASLLVVTDQSYDPSWTQEQCKRWVNHHRVFHEGHRLQALDVEQKTVTLEGVDPIRYGRLLLATGQENSCPDSCVMSPNASRYFIPAGQLHAGCDWRECTEPRHYTLLGLDWYACVLASEIRTWSGGLHSVTILFPESEPLGEFLPKEVAKQVAQSLRDLGIELIPYAEPRYIQERTDTAAAQSDLELFFVRTYDRSVAVSFRTDRFTVLNKARPPGGVAVLKQVQHLEIDAILGGIVCNRELAAASDVYVAGDALCFPDPVAGRRRACGLEHACRTARMAARNMRGARQVYSDQAAHQFSFGSTTLLWFGDLHASDEMYQYVCSGVDASGESANGRLPGPEHTIVVYVRGRSTVTGILWVRAALPHPDALGFADDAVLAQTLASMKALIGQRVPSYGGSGTANATLEPRVREIFRCFTPYADRMRRRRSSSSGGGGGAHAASQRAGTPASRRGFGG
jgi:hypothetical protein